MLRGGHLDRLAKFTPSIEAPAVGEAAALVRLRRLDEAGILPFQKDTPAVFTLHEREMLTVRTEPREALDKLTLREVELRCDGLDLRGRDDHITRPAAAVSTALAEIGCVRLVKRHDAGCDF